MGVPLLFSQVYDSEAFSAAALMAGLIMGAGPTPTTSCALHPQGGFAQKGAKIVNSPPLFGQTAEFLCRIIFASGVAATISLWRLPGHI